MNTTLTYEEKHLNYSKQVVELKNKYRALIGESLVDESYYTTFKNYSLRELESMIHFYSDEIAVLENRSRENTFDVADICK